MKHKNLISTLTLTLSSPLALQAQSRPNIILFLVDDMGWQDTSVPFDTVRTTWNNTYHTPNMEKLALKGVKFTQAYASAISSPTRVSLMTGMNPTAHRVTNWTLNRDKSQDQADKTLDFPSWNMNGLQPVGTGISNTIEATTLPQILQQNGYYTIHCGKAHFGATQTPGANPKNIGFDVNIAGHAAGGTASYLGKKNFGNVA
ncbi:MAG: sulfatase-like hydrolase/transferase, partial [Mucinivorans sp.]